MDEVVLTGYLMFAAHCGQYRSTHSRHSPLGNCGVRRERTLGGGTKKGRSREGTEATTHLPKCLSEKANRPHFREASPLHTYVCRGVCRQIRHGKNIHKPQTACASAMAFLPSRRVPYSGRKRTRVVADVPPDAPAPRSFLIGTRRRLRGQPPDLA